MSKVSQVVRRCLKLNSTDHHGKSIDLRIYKTKNPLPVTCWQRVLEMDYARSNYSRIVFLSRITATTSKVVPRQYQLR
ncbi:MAG: hypothetical protein AABN95_17010 [Acidobacteriota bacterium]